MIKSVCGLNGSNSVDGIAAAHGVVPNERCEFCNTPGCHWTRHEQAHVDVRRAEREDRARENE